MTDLEIPTVLPRPLTVFVSYRWGSASDMTWVDSLCRSLRRRGINVLLDRWEVRLGESFIEYMTRSIATADALLFVITSRSVAALDRRRRGGALRFEMQLALARKIAGDRFRVIGILRQGSQIPRSLRDSRYVDFRDDNLFKVGMSELVGDLYEHTATPPVRPVQTQQMRIDSLTSHIWRILPHAARIAVRSIPPAVQSALIASLTRTVKTESAPRGYAFGVVSLHPSTASVRKLKQWFAELDKVVSNRSHSTLQRLNSRRLPTAHVLYESVVPAVKGRTIVLIVRTSNAGLGSDDPVMSRLLHLMDRQFLSDASVSVILLISRLRPRPSFGSSVFNVFYEYSWQ